MFIEANISLIPLKIWLSKTIEGDNIVNFFYFFILLSINNKIFIINFNIELVYLC